jgi:hypothetical protein
LINRKGVIALSVSCILNNMYKITHCTARYKLQSSYVTYIRYWSAHKMSKGVDDNCGRNLCFILATCFAFADPVVVNGHHHPELQDAMNQALLQRTVSLMALLAPPADMPVQA